MNWIWAGFGFAFGAWLFVQALRWISAHPAAVVKVVGWTIKAAISATLVTVALTGAFAISQPFGWAVLIIGGYILLITVLGKAVTSPVREP